MEQKTAHKIASSALALLFLVLVSQFSTVFRYLLVAIGVYAIVFLGYNLWYLKKHNFFTLWSWLRPFFFVSGMFSLFWVIPSGGARELFLIFSTFLLFLVELWILKASEQKVFLETLFSIFGLIVSIFAFDSYLRPTSSIILVLLFISIFVISRGSFDLIPVSEQKKSFFSWLLALLMLEISWAMIYLPLNYAMTAIVLFNIYYAFWMIIYYYLYHNLSSKKIFFHLTFSIIIIMLALVSTPWRVG